METNKNQNTLSKLPEKGVVFDLHDGSGNKGYFDDNNVLQVIPTQNGREELSYGTAPSFEVEFKVRTSGQGAEELKDSIASIFEGRHLPARPALDYGYDEDNQTGLVTVLPPASDINYQPQVDHFIPDTHFDAEAIEGEIEERYPVSDEQIDEIKRALAARAMEDRLNRQAGNPNIPAPRPKAPEVITSRKKWRLSVLATVAVTSALVSGPAYQSAAAMAANCGWNLLNPGCYPAHAGDHFDIGHGFNLFNYSNYGEK